MRSRLAEFPNISYYKGWIPERFREVESLRFSFVHVDVDLEQPTRDSLEFFYPRLSPGGVLLCDDYGSSLCPGATSAKMISLSPGGGFLVRGVCSPVASLA